MGAKLGDSKIAKKAFLGSRWPTIIFISFESFWCFTKFSFHHKRKYVWLLLISMVYRSCPTTRQTTQTLEPQETRKYAAAHHPTRKSKTRAGLKYPVNDRHRKHPPPHPAPDTPNLPPPSKPATNKGIKRKWKLCRQSFHNILRPLDASPNSPFTTNETMLDYHLTWYIQHSPRAAEQPRTQLVSNTSRIIGDIQGGIPITAENQAHASAADSRKDTTINTL